MKKLLCLICVMLISISCIAYGETTTTVTEIPTNMGSHVRFDLTLNLLGVTEHVYAYDVTIDYSDASFEYTYSGETKKNPTTEEIDYSGVTGKWTKDEAKLTITCNEQSDIIQVYVRESSDMSVTDYNLNTVATITSDNTTKKDNLKTLNPSDELTITYNIEGDLPVDRIFVDPKGNEYRAYDSIGETLTDDLFSVTVFITDEFGNGTNSWI